MIEKIKGRVTNILLDRYVIENISDGSILHANIKGSIKKKNNVLVGDIVYIERSYDKYIIQEVSDRKNELIRPPVANIDQLIIMMAISNPEPDYILLDKELILCISKNIIPVICINKIDLIKDNPKLKDDITYINRVYGSLGIKIIYTSLVDKTGYEDIKEMLKDKISAFSGNSGVGKSSITNEIVDVSNIEIGEVSKKNKGKHTTKSVIIYNIGKDTYVLDTPGFSSYELYDINYKELKNYYKEFLNCKCDYDDCMHAIEKEDVCDVKRKVKSGKIDHNRYDRYVYIFNKLKEVEDRKYK